MSTCSTPNAGRASTTALITAGGAPTAPDSPMPLAPSGLLGHGVAMRPGGEVGQVGGRRHEVVEQVGGERLARPGSYDHLLEERLGDALGDAAVHLPSASSGLITVPQSSTQHALRTATSPVSRSISTTQP